MYPPLLKDMKFQFCCLSTSELLYLIAFVNVRIGNFAAINSKIFICKFPSFFDHFPLVDTALQKALQPDFDASVCITKFDSFCLSDLPLFNLKFSTNERSSCFHRLFDTISTWYEQAWFSDFICCCCKYLSYRKASRTA